LQYAGDLKDYYAVSVSGNWPLIFQFEGQHAVNVDLVDPKKKPASSG
jgi:toxin HigB-1